MKQQKTFLTDRQILQEALLYEHKQDFRNNSPKHYSAAIRRNLFELATSHMSPMGNLLERFVYKIQNGKIIYVGLTCNIKRRQIAHRNDPKMVLIFGKNLILETISDLLPANEASLFESNKVKDFKSKGFVVINKAKPGGLGKLENKYSDDVIAECALLCKTRTEFARSYPQAYQIASEKNIMDDVCSHMPKRVPRKFLWTFEMCAKEALKYRYRGDFAKGSKQAYLSARRQGFLDQICEHMHSFCRTVPKKWDFDTVIKTALNCENYREFQLNFNGAYQMCMRNGWIVEVKKVFEKRNLDTPRRVSDT